MKRLIIVEKPSVAREFASFTKAKKMGDSLVYVSDKYVIVPCFGHLVTLYDMKDYNSEYTSWKVENYPYIPNEFLTKVSDDNGVKTQFEFIKKFATSDQVNSIIDACDNDREGTLISARIMDLIETDKPRYRMKYDEVTFEDFKDAINKLVPIEETKHLIDEATARQEADWIIGINLTSVTSLKMNTTNDVLNIGRVILPIVKFVYDREVEIENFVPEDFYQLKATFKTSTGVFEAMYYENDETKFDQAYLNDILPKLKYSKIEKLEKKSSKGKAPKLHNLTSFQKYMDKTHNMNIEKTFKICQTLYEAGYTSYPRTESKALMTSSISKMENTFNKLVNVYEAPGASFLTSEGNIRTRVFNDDEVKSHSALTPTAKIPNFENLTSDEKLVYDELAKSFLSQFMPNAVFNAIEVEVNVSGYIFKASGKSLKKPGYLILYPEVKQSDFIEINEDDNVFMINSEVHNGKTSAKPRLTDIDLLGLMESVGKSVDEADFEDILKGYQIGTAATRTDSILKVINAGYIEKKGKSYRITNVGRKLMELLPCQNIIDPQFSGKVEMLLSNIGKGTISKEEFMSGIIAMTKSVTEQIKAMDNTIIKDMTDIQVATCPICGESIIDTPKAFGCMGYKKGCTYAVYKDNKLLKTLGIKVTSKFINTLVESNNRLLYFNIQSSQGKLYDVELNYIEVKEGDKTYWKFEPNFDFEYPVIGDCPKSTCKGSIQEQGKLFKCTECDLQVWRNNNILKFSKKKELKSSDVKKLITKGEFEVKNISKNNTEYTVFVGFDDDYKYLVNKGYKK